MSNNTQTPPETVTYDIELTDTFGGEANYSWAKRQTIEVPAAISDRALIRRAKREIGLCGPHRKADLGETIELRPVGACLICFITPRY